MIKFDSVRLDCVDLEERTSTINYPGGKVSKGDGKSRVVCVNSGKSV